MGWDEMSDTIDTLIQKIDRYFKTANKNISVISPLLRTGGIVGGILAIKMRVIPMLPIQFKHSDKPGDIKQMISMPDLLCSIPSPMSILLCEGNTSTGSTAIKAAKVIKEKYPLAKIYLATLTKVFGCPDKLDGIEEIFYGRMTDENFIASEEEKSKFNLRFGITIFPWENSEDELKEVNLI